MLKAIEFLYSDCPSSRGTSTISADEIADPIEQVMPELLSQILFGLAEYGYSWQKPGDLPVKHYEGHASGTGVGLTLTIKVYILPENAERLAIETMLKRIILTTSIGLPERAIAVAIISPR